MKERPILFSCPMVRAILAGKKTVTRRLVKPLHFTAADDAAMLSRCPYGVAGDRLWVRETFAAEDLGADGHRLVWRADREATWGSGAAGDRFYLDSDYEPEQWRPSIFMRRAACRIVLDVVSVRVERLQDIDDDDIAREGVTAKVAREMCGGDDTISSPLDAWIAGWDAINGKRAPWASNPWVWRVEFRKVQP